MSSGSTNFSPTRAQSLESTEVGAKSPLANPGDDPVLEKMANMSFSSKMVNQRIYSKHDFWESNFKICLACNAHDVLVEENCFSDDSTSSRGAATFTCKACNWKIVFRYDDALEPRFFETRGWKKSTKMRNVAVGIMAARRLGGVFGAGAVITLQSNGDNMRYK
eukprot:CAMPEP_0179487626 /NCGR_PEP_ID=MMETSP0799-20121207/63545_1 /TAXON_ID=46947 /ORGANISM="Geminigera cryophila, Strain CCMP2564" /LENGTH=163 /DNA_ID=CAMNT_0021302803 /DNA_START=97 /DNA_END=589 /DNA_ORIENTATION=+